MFNELISVIVPAYNVANYVKSCVESLVNQTYKNIEIIIVEDCSTDNTLEICNNLKNIYKNITLLKNDKNCGLEATREKGISISKGQWIMFLDSDDTYSLTGIEECCKSLENKPDIVFCPYAKIKKDSRLVSDCTMNEGLYSPKVFCSSLLSEIKLDYLFCIGSKIYNRKFLEMNNIHFNSRYKFNEDGGFVIDSLKKAKSIYVNHVCYYQYNIRTNGSIQSSYRPKMLDTISNVYDSLKELLLANDAFHGESRRAFYIQKASIFLDSLDNEVKYSNFNSFKEVFKNIKRDTDYKDIFKVVKKEKNKAFLAMHISFKFSLKRLLYFLLKWHNRKAK